MGFFRIIGVILISLFLIISLIGFGVTETLQKSTKYENIEYKLTDISKDFITENIKLESTIEQALPFMQTYCMNNTDAYSFQESGYSFEISCDSINQGTDQIIDDIIDQTITAFIENYYYQDYNCEMIECLQQQPLVLMSEKAHEYWTEKSNLLLIISLGLAVVLFFLTKHKSNFFMISGGLVVGTSILISQLPDIASDIAMTTLSPAISTLEQLGASSDIFAKIARAFFSQAEEVYLWFLLVGILLIGVGILFKVFNLAGKISTWIKNRKNKKNQTKEGSEKEEE